MCGCHRKLPRGCWCPAATPTQAPPQRGHWPVDTCSSAWGRPWRPLTLLGWTGQRAGGREAAGGTWGRLHRAGSWGWSPRGHGLPSLPVLAPSFHTWHDPPPATCSQLHSSPSASGDPHPDGCWPGGSALGAGPAGLCQVMRRQAGGGGREEGKGQVDPGTEGGAAPEASPEKATEKLPRDWGRGRGTRPEPTSAGWPSGHSSRPTAKPRTENWMAQAQAQAHPATSRGPWVASG